MSTASSETIKHEVPTEVLDLEWFEKPRFSPDSYIIELYERFGLPRVPCVRAIAPVAVELLDEKPPNYVSAAELMLGRHLTDEDLESEDSDSLGQTLKNMRGTSQKIAVLLTLAQIEQRLADKKQMLVDKRKETLAHRIGGRLMAAFRVLH